MGKCEWCGKEGKMNTYADAFGDNYEICDECKSTAEKGKCRVCGESVDVSMMIKGLCTNCIQADMYEQGKKFEESRIGVGDEFRGIASSAELELTDEEYEQWLLMGNTFSHEEFRDSTLLRKIWIMVKLFESGKITNEILEANMVDIEETLDRSFSKMIGVKCLVMIAETPEDRRVIREHEIIDTQNKVFILKL